MPTRIGRHVGNVVAPIVKRTAEIVTTIIVRIVDRTHRK